MRIGAEDFFAQADRVTELRAADGPDSSELAAALAELEVRRAAVLASIPPLEEAARRFIKNS